MGDCAPMRDKISAPASMQRRPYFERIVGDVLDVGSSLWRQAEVARPDSWPWKLAITRSARLRAASPAGCFPEVDRIGLGLLIAKLVPRRNVLPKEIIRVPWLAFSRSPWLRPPIHARLPRPMRWPISLQLLERSRRRPR